MKLTMKMTGLERQQSRARKAILYSERDAAEVTREFADRLVAAVKRNASGRPGPNVITGAYRESIHSFSEDAFTFGAGTSAPQAMRLEFGFVGVDSLGREYNQGSFPHWTPAVDEIKPQYVKAMHDRARRWWAP